MSELLQILFDSSPTNSIKKSFWANEQSGRRDIFPGICWLRIMFGGFLLYYQEIRKKRSCLKWSQKCCLVTLTEKNVSPCQPLYELDSCLLFYDYVYLFWSIFVHKYFHVEENNFKIALIKFWIDLQYSNNSLWVVMQIVVAYNIFFKLKIISWSV